MDFSKWAAFQKNLALSEQHFCHQGTKARRKIYMKEIIKPDNALPASGPYSPAVKAAGLIFVSGQLPLTKEGCPVGGGIKEQTIQALENLKAVLAGAGLSLEQVVKTTVYLKDISDFSIFNGIYGQYFTASPPARACVGVSALPKGVSVEIEAIAVQPTASSRPAPEKSIGKESEW